MEVDLKEDRLNEGIQGKYYQLYFDLEANEIEGRGQFIRIVSNFVVEKLFFRSFIDI